MNILGVAAMCRAAGAVCLRNGELVAGSAEERLSRVPGDQGWPWRSVRQALLQAELTLADLDCVALHPGPMPATGVGRAVDTLRRTLGCDCDVEVVTDPRPAQAAASFYASGEEEAAVMLVGLSTGDLLWTRASRRNGVAPLVPGSGAAKLARLCTSFAAWLGIDQEDLPDLLEWVPSLGEPAFATRIDEALAEPERPGAVLGEIFGPPPRDHDRWRNGRYLDVASSVEAVIDAIVVDAAAVVAKSTMQRTVCLGGGSAASIRLAARVVARSAVERVFVPPLPDGLGAAIGAAALCHATRSGGVPRIGQASVGPTLHRTGPSDLLRHLGLAHQGHLGDPFDELDDVVRTLAEGRIVGWCRDRMELAGSALGTRSILADPSDPSVQHRVNAVIKQRDERYPLPAVVLAEGASELFATEGLSMRAASSVAVRTKDLPAITQPDGTAMVSVADPEAAPELTELLRRFAQRSGHAVLVNAPFSVAGEPVACSAADALACMARPGIDLLWLDGFTVDRQAIPPYWEVVYSGNTEQQPHAENLLGLTGVA